MAADFQTGVAVTVDSSGARVGAQQVQTSLRGIGQQAEKTQATVRRSTTLMGGAFLAVRNAIQRVVRWVFSLQGALAGLGVSIGLGAILRTASSFEQLRVQLKTVTGSAENARKAFANIKQFAVDTPFQVENLTEAFIGLKAVGIEPTNELLRSFSDISAAFGRDILEFSNAARAAAFGEAEALKRFGIIMRTEGEQVTITFDGVTKTVKKDAQSIIKELVNIGKVRFAGAAKAQMDTFKGVVSNLGDVIADTFDTAASKSGGFLEFMKQSISDFRAALQSPAFQKAFQAVLDSIVMGLRAFASAIDFVIRNINTLANVIIALLIRSALLRLAAILPVLVAAVRSFGVVFAITAGQIGIFSTAMQLARGITLGFFGALAANPFGAFVLGITVAVGLLLEFGHLLTATGRALNASKTVVEENDRAITNLNGAIKETLDFRIREAKATLANTDARIKDIQSVIAEAVAFKKSNEALYKRIQLMLLILRLSGNMTQANAIQALLSNVGFMSDADIQEMRSALATAQESRSRLQKAIDDATKRSTIQDTDRTNKTGKPKPSPTVDKEAIKKQSEAIKKVKESTEALRLENEALQKGALAWQQYQENLPVEEMRKLLTDAKVAPETIDKLTEAFSRQLGVNRQLKKEMEEYKATMQSVAGAFENTLSNLGSTLTAIMKNPKNALEELKNFALRTFETIINKAWELLVIKPIMDALFGAGRDGTGGILGSLVGAFAGGLGGTTGIGGTFATGAGFNRGRVVAKPELFPMATGMGLMGEKGPEAVLPLAQTSRGLGVVAKTGSSEGGRPIVINMDLRGSNGDASIEQAVTRGIRRAAPGLIEASVMRVENDRRREPGLRDR